MSASTSGLISWSRRCQRARHLRPGERDRLDFTAAADQWRGRDDRATHPSRGTASTAYALSHCARRLTARGPVHRCVETMVGTIELERPYFYCVGCREGTYPLDEVLDVSAGRIQRDVQQAAVDLATEVPYETASTLLSRLSGITVSSERMHTITHQGAEGLSVLEVAPSREEIERRVRQVAAGRFRLRCWGSGLMGPMCRRDLRARAGAAPGKHATGRDGRAGDTSGVKPRGFSFYLLDGERIVHVLSWPRCKPKRNWARPCSR